MSNRYSNSNIKPQKIKIIVPQAKEKWKVVINSSRYHRASVNTAFLLTEKLLLKATQRGKTCVRVQYGHGYHNGTIDSQDLEYLVYATSCFLEDYLSQQVLHKYEKRWLKNLDKVPVRKLTDNEQTVMV